MKFEFKDIFLKTPKCVQVNYFNISYKHNLIKYLILSQKYI